jgi:hypothetical protein
MQVSLAKTTKEIIMNTDKMLEKIANKDFEIRRAAAQKEAEIYELTEKAERLAKETLTGFYEIIMELSRKGMIDRETISKLGETYKNVDLNVGNDDILLWDEGVEKIGSFDLKTYIIKL